MSHSYLSYVTTTLSIIPYVLYLMYCNLKIQHLSYLRFSLGIHCPYTLAHIKRFGSPYFHVYACYACLCHSLAFCAFLHACLYVHALVLLVSVSSTLQHNEVMDIRSKPTFVPRGHHLLFAFLLASLLVCWLAFLPLSHATLAISILLVCFAPFSHYLRISSFPLLVCWFLVFAFACTHLERGRMELGHGLPGASKKDKDASMPI